MDYDQYDFTIDTMPPEWFNGRYVYYQSKTDNTGVIFYMHESGQAYLKLTSSTTWRLVQYNNVENDLSTSTLYTGTVTTEYDKFTNAEWERTDSMVPDPRFMTFNQAGW